MTSYCISTAARVNYSHPCSVICFVLDSKMDTRSKRRRDFDLEVDGWSDDKENEPVEKRKRLSLCLNKKKPAERYEFLEDEDLVSLAEKYTAKNTATSTRWAVKNFEDWRKARKEHFPDKDQVPDDLFRDGNRQDLCKFLSAYVAETRKQDGSPYPPKTVYALLTGLLRHSRTLNAASPNFLDTEDPSFFSFHASLDNLFCRLRSSGIGSQSKSAEIFTKVDQKKLWDDEILGLENPKSLLRAVFFLNGKNFALRGGEEHRQLKLSQVKRFYDPDHYVYTENSSKNRSGGLAQLRVTNKRVPVYAVPEAGEKCHVSVLDKYLSKLPLDAIERDNFYLTPLPAVPSNSQRSWFTSVPVGRNSLGKMVKEMCSDSGIGGNKANHA